MAERNTRFNSNGQVFISQVANTDVLLKNLSASGLCIESQKLMEIVPNTRVSVDIVPEKESNIDKFSLEIESRWIKTKLRSSESGFIIVVPPGTSGRTLLEQYLKYLEEQAEEQVEEEENDGEAATAGFPPVELLS